MEGRSKLERLFQEQKGVCPWCCYTMIMTWPNTSIDALATIDHLLPHPEADAHGIRSYEKRIAKRFKVAAHRYCNNARGHSLGISDEAKRRIKKSAVSLGLTLNKTVANHIWSQKIRHAFALRNIESESPFRKSK